MMITGARMLPFTCRAGEARFSGIRMSRRERGLTGAERLQDLAAEANDSCAMPSPRGLLEPTDRVVVDDQTGFIAGLRQNIASPRSPSRHRWARTRGRASAKILNTVRPGALRTHRAAMLRDERLGEREPSPVRLAPTPAKKNGRGSHPGSGPLSSIATATDRWAFAPASRSGATRVVVESRTAVATRACAVGTILTRLRELLRSASNSAG